jgi:hypothetical protein
MSFRVRDTGVTVGPAHTIMCSIAAFTNFRRRLQFGIVLIIA